MSGVQEQAQVTAPQATTKMSSRELAVYTKYKPMLAELLVSSLTRLALLAAGQKLITNTTVAEKFGQTSTQEERAKFLVDAVMAKMDKRMDAAATVMKEFIECVEETVQLHAFLNQKYEAQKEKGTKQPEKEVLNTNQAAIASNLQFNLVSVSGRLLQCGIITSEEHSVFVNPGAKYEDLMIGKVLDEIGTSIKIDERKFNTFLDEVLEEIGGPAEEIAGRMRNLLDADDEMDFN